MSYYVVDPINGKDPNSGTEASPWKTIAKLNSMLQPGDMGLIRGGEYIEKIQPARSGLMGTPITYQVYEGESVVIADVAQGAVLNRDFIILDGIGFTGRNPSSPTMSTWVYITGKNNTLIRCKAEYSTDYGGIYADTGASNTRILYGDFYYNTGGETIRIDGPFTLIEGTRVRHGEHNCIGLMANQKGTAHHLMVISCDISNPIYRGAGWGDDSRWDTFTLFEGNKVHDIVTRLDPPQEYNAEAIQINAKYSIFRKNLIYNVSGCGLSLDSWYVGSPYFHVYKHQFTKAYQNTIVKCGQHVGGPYFEIGSGIRIRYREDGDFPFGSFLGNALKNNILYANTRPGVWWEYGLMNALNYYDLAGNWLEENGDPQFEDPQNNDYRLKAGSPCIGSGVFLTKTRSVGSGQSIPVEDAGYFCDGWGMKEGDLIQLEGQIDPVKILGIDHDANILQLDRSISWSAGQGVSLPYEGKAPDKGAFVYFEEVPPVAKTYNLSLTLNVLPASGFTLSADALSKSIRLGEAGFFTITVNAIEGFAGQVKFTVTGLPTGVTATFTPAQVAPGASTRLDIAVAANAAPATVALVVTGTEVV